MTGVMSNDKNYMCNLSLKYGKSSTLSNPLRSALFARIRHCGLKIQVFH